MSAVAPPRPSLDPRLRARRAAVAREAGRRRLHRLVALGAVLGALLVVAGVSRSPLVAVHHVRIAGAQQTEPAGLSAAIGPVQGRPIYAVDTGAIRRRLEALPWVKTARVERSWPQTITVTVGERTAVAVARAADGSERLVDADARVLATTARPPPDMVEIVGPSPPGDPGTVLGAGARDALAVVDALPLTLAGRITQAEWTGDGQVRLALAPYGRVLVGTPTQLPQKLLALTTLLGRVKPEEVGEIDLRAPDAPALRRADLTVIGPAASVQQGTGP